MKRRNKQSDPQTPAGFPAHSGATSKAPRVRTGAGRTRPWRHFFGHKKREEACASSPCRSIGSPLTRHCRCLKAFPTPTVPQGSAPGLRSRTFYARLIYRRLSTPRLHQSSLVPPSTSGALARSACPPFRLAPSRPGGSSGSRLPNLILLWPKPFPIRSTFRSLHCFRSVGLPRLSPPGVYLQGSRIPFESLRLVRPASQSPARVTCSVPLEHLVPCSSTLRFAFRRVGLQAGGFCLTGGSDYSSENEGVKSVFGEFRVCM
jgi:hypothetical protein